MVYPEYREGPSQRRHDGEHMQRALPVENAGPSFPITSSPTRRVLRHTRERFANLSARIRHGAISERG